MKMSVRMSFSSGRPRTSSGCPRASAFIRGRGFTRGRGKNRVRAVKIASARTHLRPRGPAPTQTGLRVRAGP
jgi:hypothetical protein